MPPIKAPIPPPPGVKPLFTFPVLVFFMFFSCFGIFFFSLKRKKGKLGKGSF